MQQKIDIYSMHGMSSKFVAIDKEVRSTVDCVIDSLINYFKGGENPSRFGLIIEKTETERQVAKITYPFGNARFVLKWGVDEGRPIGMLIAERERHDEYDRIYWEQALQLNIKNNDVPYLINGHCAEKLHLRFGALGDGKDDATFIISSELAYSLMYGPKHQLADN